jgi:nitrite reductase/ring-hydroxylating ferredoxin subunit
VPLTTADNWLRTPDAEGFEMAEQAHIAGDPPADSVRRLGRWAVGSSNGRDFAVSRRCRHQLGDLSQGHLDAAGCLVCPWHQSRYDTTTGAMVEGPQGFLGYHGRTPGYTQIVLAYGRHLKLRVRRLVRTASGFDVE